MPTYDYICEKCHKEFELVQSMKDEPIKTCPDKKCKGKVKRLIGTGAGLIFKGSGFYITDYRSDSYKQGAKKDTSGSETKTDSKPQKTEKPSPPKSGDK